MRGRKWTVLITAPIALLACSGLFIFQVCNKILYDISLAVLGSAILGFIIALIEYFAEKRRAMETYYTEALNAAKILGKAVYFLPDEPISLVANCIGEEVNNEMISRVSENAPLEWTTTLGEKKSVDAKNAMLSFLVQKYKSSNGSEVDTEFIEEQYREKIAQYKKDMNECMDSYIKIADSNLGNLDNALGNLDFIFTNRSVRKTVYSNFHEKIRKMRYEAVEKAYHFRLVKSGEGNLSVCLGFILEINNIWFKTEHSVKDDYEIKTIYRSVYDDLCNDIERFRAKIYGQEPTIYESKPFISHMALMRKPLSNNAEQGDHP